MIWVEKKVGQKNLNTLWQTKTRLSLKCLAKKSLKLLVQELLVQTKFGPKKSVKRSWLKVILVRKLLIQKTYGKKLNLKILYKLILVEKSLNALWQTKNSGKKIWSKNIFFQKILVQLNLVRKIWFKKKLRQDLSRMCSA